MKYTIKRLNRTVELDDELVQAYCEYETLRDQPFAIVIRTKFGHNPTVSEISDKNLSVLCNEILLAEMKAFALLPKAIDFIKRKETELYYNAKTGKHAEYSL